MFARLVLIISITLSISSIAIAVQAKPSLESGQCSGCHQQQVHSWQQSHHFMAMQQATDEYVLGEFDTVFRDDSGWTRFYKENEKFFIETGKNDEAGLSYPIRYTFGVEPLQQVLVDIGGGRLQAYPIAWDSRAEQQGGQRWFNLYDDIHSSDSPFYWQGQFNNWNARCAQCHSSNLQRNYQLDTDTYQTTYDEINVSCQSCHGNAERHIELKKNGQTDLHSGFAKPLAKKHAWSFKEGQSTASLLGSIKNLASSGQLDTCASCHSRRVSLLDGEVLGDYAQHHIPRLAEPDLYHADGQILDEVYVFGSFTQSKMAAAGVTCTNCHDAHTGKVASLDNALCSQCHLPATFDTQDHTLHKTGSDGASCISCHMPQTTYMGVDKRRDHAFRVPNPWVSEALNTKDVCLDCHVDKDSQWSQSKLAHKQEAVFNQFDDIGTALLVNQQQPQQGQAHLRQLILDQQLPEMRRAVWVTHLDTTQQDNLQTLHAAANGDSYLVKLAVLDALERVPFAMQVQLGFGLLYDDNKNVRIKAIQLLAPALTESIPDDARAPLQKTLREAVKTYQGQQDMLSAQMALADLAYKVKNYQQATLQYKNAIALQPNFLPAKINLASIYRETGKTADSKKLLHEVLQVEPNHAMALFNLGLAHIIDNEVDEAAEALEQAARIEPDNLHYGLTYLLALERKGDMKNAKGELERLKALTPNDPMLVQLEQRLNNQ